MNNRPENPFIHLSEGMPGIVGLLNGFPETGVLLRQLADTLLCGANSLTSGERELIAAYVSAKNGCQFCSLSHAAAATAHLGSEKLVQTVCFDGNFDGISDKLKALLVIAGETAISGKNVSAESVEKAKQYGATDKEIHDTVLIAAAFCLFNRYVDGLATLSSPNPADYVDMGKRMAQVI